MVHVFFRLSLGETQRPERDVEGYLGARLKAVGCSWGRVVLVVVVVMDDADNGGCFLFYRSGGGW